MAFQVFQHIFTGPSTAMNPSTGPHKTKAKKFKLTEVTGRTIAYASVQVSDFQVSFYSIFANLNLKTYIALSSMSQWASYDNVFNLEEFYNSIVMTFETDPKDPWVVDTLEWWNE